MKWIMKILSKGKKKRAGFTLVELMIVVIVVGILAAAAIPIYWWAMARAYSSEARALLGAVRSVQQIYFAEHGVFEDYTTWAGTNDTLFEQFSGIKLQHNKWWHAAQLTYLSADALAYAVADGGGSASFAAGGPWIIADGAKGAAPASIHNITNALGLSTGTWVVSFDHGASWKVE